MIQVYMKGKLAEVVLNVDQMARRGEVARTTVSSKGVYEVVFWFKLDRLQVF